MSTDLQIPLIICGAAILGLIVILILQKLGGAKQKGKSSPQSNSSDSHELMNIQDIRGKILYTSDGKKCAFFEVYPITISLLSEREKKDLTRYLATELATETKPFKFLANSKPIDISPMISHYKRRFDVETDERAKDILRNEIINMSNYAQEGEVVKRQFHFMLWEPKEGNDELLLKRINEFKEKFKRCKLSGKVLNQQEIARLAHLSHTLESYDITETDMLPSIPMIVDLLN